MMNSHLKCSLLLTIAGCFVAMSASAKVTPIGKYIGSTAMCKGNDCKREASCGAKGFYDDTNGIIGATCQEVRIIGNKKCYSCSCDTSKYPFTSGNCSTTGFTAPSLTASNGCYLPPTEKRSELTYYKNCLCNNNVGYYEASKIEYSLSDVFSTSSGYNTTVKAANDSSKSLTCYNTAKYSCKNGAKNKTQDTKGNITIKYTTKHLIKSGSGTGDFTCTTGVASIEGDGKYDSTKECLEKKTATTPYHNQTYYYFDNSAGQGGCSSSSNCTNTKPTKDCIAYSTYTAKDYNSKNITCYKLTGCKADGDCYGSYNSSGAYGYKSNIKQSGGLGYLDFTTTEAGDYKCLKITGCKNGSSSVSNSSTTASAFENSVNTASNTVSGITYNASGMHGNTTNIRGFICKLATGCGGGSYAVTTGTDTEWIKYLEQGEVASKAGDL